MDPLLAEFLTLDPTDPEHVERIKEIQTLMRASRRPKASASATPDAQPAEPAAPEQRRQASAAPAIPLEQGQATGAAAPLLVTTAPGPPSDLVPASLSAKPAARPLDILFVEAAPLVVHRSAGVGRPATLVPVDRLEQAEERAAIVAAANDAGQPVVLQALPGTLDGLVAALTPRSRTAAARGHGSAAALPADSATAGQPSRGFGARVLHITGHGGEVQGTAGPARGFLLLEGPGGEGHTVFADTLRAMLPAARSGAGARGPCPCDLAVVASCSSEAVGRALLEAGVAPAVVAVRQSTRVADRITIRFVRSLYEALAQGEAVTSAFSRASARARAETERNALAGQARVPTSMAEPYVILWPRHAHDVRASAPAGPWVPSDVVLATGLDTDLLAGAPAAVSGPVFDPAPAPGPDCSGLAGRLERGGTSGLAIRRPWFSSAVHGDDGRSDAAATLSLGGGLHTSAAGYFASLDADERADAEGLAGAAGRQRSLRGPEAVDVTPVPLFRRLPRPPWKLVGRMVDMYAVVATVRKARVTCLRGSPGVGKSAVALAAAQFLVPRHGIPGNFADGVVVVKLRSVRSWLGLHEALWSAILAAGGGDTRRAGKPRRRRTASGGAGTAIAGTASGADGPASETPTSAGLPTRPHARSASGFGELRGALVLPSSSPGAVAGHTDTTAALEQAAAGAGAAGPYARWAAAGAAHLQRQFSSESEAISPPSTTQRDPRDSCDSPCVPDAVGAGWDRPASPREVRADSAPPSRSPGRQPRLKADGSADYHAAPVPRVADGSSPPRTAAVAAHCALAPPPPPRTPERCLPAPAAAMDDGFIQSGEGRAGFPAQSGAIAAAAAAADLDARSLADASLPSMSAAGSVVSMGSMLSAVTPLRAPRRSSALPSASPDDAIRRARSGQHGSAAGRGSLAAFGHVGPMDSDAERSQRARDRCRALRRRIVSALNGRSVLLLLDDVDEPLMFLPRRLRALLTRLLDCAPGVSVLATSRSPLGMGGGVAGEEKDHVLPPLGDSAAADLLVQVSPAGERLLRAVTQEQLRAAMTRRGAVTHAAFETRATTARAQRLAALAMHPVIRQLCGHPQAVCLAARMVGSGQQSLDELQAITTPQQHRRRAGSGQSRKAGTGAGSPPDCSDLWPVAAGFDMWGGAARAEGAYPAAAASRQGSGALVRGDSHEHERSDSVRGGDATLVGLAMASGHGPALLTAGGDDPMRACLPVLLPTGSSSPDVSPPARSSPGGEGTYDSKGPDGTSTPSTRAPLSQGHGGNYGGSYAGMAPAGRAALLSMELLVASVASSDGRSLALLTLVSMFPAGLSHLDLDLIWGCHGPVFASAPAEAVRELAERNAEALRAAGVAMGGGGWAGHGITDRDELTATDGALTDGSDVMYGSRAVPAWDGYSDSDAGDRMSLNSYAMAGQHSQSRQTEPFAGASSVAGASLASEMLSASIDGGATARSSTGGAGRQGAGRRPPKAGLGGTAGTLASSMVSVDAPVSASWAVTAKGVLASYRGGTTARRDWAGRLRSLVDTSAVRRRTLSARSPLAEALDCWVTWVEGGETIEEAERRRTRAGLGTSATAAESSVRDHVDGSGGLADAAVAAEAEAAAERARRTARRRVRERSRHGATASRPPAFLVQPREPGAVPNSPGRSGAWEQGLSSAGSEGRASAQRQGLATVRVVVDTFPLFGNALEAILRQVEAAHEVGDGERSRRSASPRRRTRVRTPAAAAAPRMTQTPGRRPRRSRASPRRRSASVGGRPPTRKALQTPAACFSWAFPWLRSRSRRPLPPPSPLR